MATKGKELESDSDTFRDESQESVFFFFLFFYFG